MIIITSISPTHISDQLTAINSWKKLECEIYSLNGENEIERVKSMEFGVKILPTHRTLEYFVGKKLVSINAMIDLAIEMDEDLLLINSDIIISHLPEFKNDGITIFSRFDFSKSYEDAHVYEFGFDAFYFPKHLLKVFTPTIYGLGCCFHDYSWAYRAMINNIPVYWADGKFIYHKAHSFQWAFDEWIIMAKFFKLEFKIEDHISLEQMSINILSEIKRRAIKIY